MIIYYRKSLFDKDELSAAKKYFKCVDLLTDIDSKQLVIGRYSLLPFYFDQEREIENLGSKLINNYQQHRYIADLQNYVADLADLTPRTWDNLVDLPANTSFILKGETNSKKQNWSESMFAPDKKSAIEIYGRLSNDSLIGYQKIYIRKFVPLHTYMLGVNGMPVTKEFRFFVAYGKVISGGYYWQNYIDELATPPSPNEVPLDFLDKVIKRVGSNSNFFVVDVAQTKSGDWIVIELNDGQQAGLSCNDPEVLYKNLFKSLRGTNG